MENKKIKVEICCGTTCYMLGAAELMQLEDLVPDKWKKLLDITGIPCMESCNREDLGRAPFVKINGELMGHATIDNVLERLSELISSGAYHE